MSQNPLTLVARQLQRETQAHEEAKQRLTSQIQAAKDKSYASSTIDSRTFINQQLHDLGSLIQQRYGALTSGKAGLDAADVVIHLKDADPFILALLTMKVALDVLGKHKKVTVQALTTSIGKAVQTELRMSYYLKENPNLYKKVEMYFHRGTGTRQKATVFNKHFNESGTEWLRWSTSVNHRVGAWLLNCLMSSTGWVKQGYKQVSAKRRESVITYTEQFLDHRDAIIEQAEDLSFLMWPMLCPPVEWTNDYNGGYLTELVRKANPLIRRPSAMQKGVEGIKQGSIPLAMLNNLQSVAYRINPLLFPVAESYYDNFQSVGKFIRDEVKPPPPPPGENPSEEDLKAYKRLRRDIEDFNAQLPQRNWRTTEAMYVARKYSHETFWHVASFDYRGRVYYSSCLNPQGTDFDKSLLYFDEEGPADEYWLLWNIATTYGRDKDTHEDRVAWARENKSLITAIATDPIHQHEWWEASEPWCFLAACLEWHSIFVLKEKTTSGLPIGIDATQSGIQHLSCLTLDAASAALVNVLPTPKPADGYLTVAEKAKDYLEDIYHDWMNRKVTKKVVMCCPYGVSQTSARGYIRQQLVEDGHREALREPGVLTRIVKAIFKDAVPAVFPGPIAVMRWLQQSAKEILEKRETIKWTAPSGFVVHQDLRKSNTVRIQTRLMGSTRMEMSIADGYLGPDDAHHRSALAPNVVHSCDAALIHLTFAFWDTPFSVIHDCVLGRSCDMEAMGKAIRLHFAEMYKAPVLQDWADEVGVEVPEGLIKGTLLVDDVNLSQYFFS